VTKPSEQPAAGTAGAAGCVDAAGVSGPVQFDMFGMVVHAESYVYGQFESERQETLLLTGFES